VQRAAARAGAQGNLTAVLERDRERDRDRERPPADQPRVVPGDLVVRTRPDMQLRHGDRVPLLVDLAHLYVFDQEGHRICPAPAEAPRLE
jgi:multiple sugar transport system ATP-binding protein